MRTAWLILFVSACGPSAVAPPVMAPTGRAPIASTSTPATPSCPPGMTGAPSGGGAPAAFCIDVTEVAVKDYDACVAAAACGARDPEHVCDDLPGAPDMPVGCVTTDQADAFCGWKGKRLPTEGEWVWAACGADGRTYPWGNAKPTTEVCWMGAPGGPHGTTQRGPCRVGSFPAGASPFGLLDAAGNLSEWTEYVGPGGKKAHTTHGGAYNGSWREMACTQRGDDQGGAHVGFRCAR